MSRIFSTRRSRLIVVWSPVMALAVYFVFAFLQDWWNGWPILMPSTPSSEPIKKFAVAFGGVIISIGMLSLALTALVLLCEELMYWVNRGKHHLAS